jgi:hypothetical protein
LIDENFSGGKKKVDTSSKEYQQNRIKKALENLNNKRNRVEISLGKLRERERQGTQIINKMIDLNVDGEKVAKDRSKGYTKKQDDDLPEDPTRIKHIPFYQKMFP